MKYSLVIAALCGFVTIDQTNAIVIRASGDDNTWGEALEGVGEGASDYSKDTPKDYMEEKKKAPKVDQKAVARQKMAEQALVE